ncbi:MAG: hypothetical protein FWG87_09585 [Defluviitaleaceae bacterium]|nr:hypothetical protein [Defluviitaleaceae bacterium]
MKTEKLWCEDVAMMYPRQWVVLADMEDEPKTFKAFGAVYFVTPNKNEAYDVCRELRNTNGMDYAMIVEGFNDTPQIGGLELWSQ